MAEELTQAVFIILARKADSLGPKTILSGWLCRTARYAAANALTIQRRRQRREMEAHMQSVGNEPESNAWQQMAPLLDTAMERLRQKDHDALVLRFFEGRNFREIGAALGSSEDAAKMRVNRAVEKLRVFFNKRGVTSTAAIVAGTLSANSVQPAPVALAQSLTAVAVSKGAAASGPTLVLVKGALKLMAWTKAKVAIIGTGMLLVVGTGTIMVRDSFISPREPTYQGRPLLDWLADIDYRQSPERRAEAQQAIRQMGRKTLPFLLADLGVKDYQERVHYSKPDSRTPDQRSGQAVWAFDALGSIGKPAISQLN